MTMISCINIKCTKKNYYNNMEKFKKQLEDNDDWSKNKIYEYIIK